MECVQPDGRKAIGLCSETEPIGVAYAKHLVLVESCPEKRKRGAERGEEPKEQRVRRQMEQLGIPPQIKQESAKPKVDPANLEKQEPRNTTDDNDSEPLEQVISNTDASIVPASTPTATQPAPPASVTFHLHHPSLPSKHPVLIPLSPDSILATSLTNRLVLEFPTIYVLPRQSNDKLPEGFISEEDFFATTKKGLIKELVEGDQLNSGMNALDDERGRGLEEGEVDQRRLLEVLGKDLKELTATV